MTINTSLDVDTLREAIREEYTDVATCPMKGFHFHTGRLLADRLGYPAERVERLPDVAIESFAGVGNPFAWGDTPRPAKRCSTWVPARGSTRSWRRCWSAPRAG